MSIIIDNNLKIKAPRKPHLYKVPFGMAFASSDNEQVSGFGGCRDYLHDMVRTFFNDKTRLSDDGHGYYPKSGDPDICVENLRIMFIILTKDLGNFEKGLELLNKFETNAKMENTTGEHVIVPNVEEGNTVILLKGSAEYMHNPHLLSLVTLIMRFVTINSAFKCEKLEDFRTSYENMVEKGSIVRDSSLMNNCYKIMPEILSERHKLFEGVSIKKLFPIEIRSLFHGKGGISELCRGYSSNLIVNKRIVELKRKMDEK